MATEIKEKDMKELLADLAKSTEEWLESPDGQKAISESAQSVKEKSDELRAQTKMDPIRLRRRISI